MRFHRILPISLLISYSLLLFSCHSTEELKKSPPQKFQSLAITIDTSLISLIHKHRNVVLQKKQTALRSASFKTSLDSNTIEILFSTQTHLREGFKQQLPPLLSRYNKAIRTYLIEYRDNVQSQYDLNIRTVTEWEQELHQFRKFSGFNEEPIALSYAIDSLYDEIQQKQVTIESLSLSLRHTKNWLRLTR